MSGNQELLNTNPHEPETQDVVKNFYFVSFSVVKVWIFWSEMSKNVDRESLPLVVRQIK